jgi:hypothetical protein
VKIVRKVSGYCYYSWPVCLCRLVAHAFVRNVLPHRILVVRSLPGTLFRVYLQLPERNACVLIWHRWFPIRPHTLPVPKASKANNCYHEATNICCIQAQSFIRTNWMACFHGARCYANCQSNSCVTCRHEAFSRRIVLVQVSLLPGNSICIQFNKVVRQAIQQCN